MFCIWYSVKIQVYSFWMWISNFPSTTCCKIILSSLNGLVSLSNIWAYILGFISGFLAVIYWPIFPSLCQYQTVWSPKCCSMFWNEKCQTTSFVLFQACFSYPGFLEILYIFYDEFFYLKKNTIRILTWIALNLWIALGSINILIFSLPVHENRLCFHLFISF